MNVELVAWTTFARDRAAVPWSPDADAPDADALAEFAGRACYRSWARPNPATATTDAYVRHVIELGHESVLEHASATFYVTGVSRSLTHELVRHRHLSFSQLSQRFVDESDATLVIPPAIRDGAALTLPSGETIHAAVDELGDRAVELYAALARLLGDAGYTRKQAREAARCVLPNATWTELVVSGNLRAWRDVLRRRLEPAADAEIQTFARRVLDQLTTLAPATFADLVQRFSPS